MTDIPPARPTVEAAPPDNQVEIGRNLGEAALVVLAVSSLFMAGAKVHDSIVEGTLTAAKPHLQSLQDIARELDLAPHLREQFIARAKGRIQTQSDHHTDGTLHLQIYNVGLRTGNIGSQLRFQAHLRAKVQTSSGMEVYYDYLEYQSPAHRAQDWAARDGALLHQQLAAAAAALTEEVIEQLLHRPVLTPDITETLAAKGITRR